MMLNVGMTANLTKTINEDDVFKFAELTGDFNPIHINEEEAEKSIFKHRIVHGCLLNGLISAVIGTHLPGIGTIYLEQDSKFLKPVYLNDTVTVKVEVKDIINLEKGIYRLNTLVYNQKGETVIEGYAVVKYLGRINDEKG